MTKKRHSVDWTETRAYFKGLTEAQLRKLKAFDPNPRSHCEKRGTRQKDSRSHCENRSGNKQKRENRKRLEPISTLEELEYLCEKTESGCWILSGRNASRLWVGERCTTIQRLAWSLKHPGTKALSYDLKHIGNTCGNPRCGNPNHLFLPSRLDRARSHCEDFWSRVWKGGENECWPYKGKPDKHASFRGMPASHVAYMLEYGKEIPKGMLLRHEPLTCHTPGCCNPRHLLLGTHRENYRDMLLDGTAKTCKLTEQDVRQIRASLESVETLADWYGVQENTIKLVLARKTWKWVK